MSTICTQFIHLFHFFYEGNILRHPFRVNFCHWPVASPYFSLFYNFVSVSLFAKWLQYVVAINKLLWDLRGKPLHFGHIQCGSN